MLPKQYRLTQERDFNSVYKSKKAFYCPLFVIKHINSANKHSRLGVVVSKKTLPKAVDRAKSKRKVRAVFYKYLPKLTKSVDIVIMLNKKALDAPTSELEKQINRFFNDNSLQ